MRPRVKTEGVKTRSRKQLQLDRQSAYGLWVDGLTHQQIAIELGLPRRTVNRYTSEKKMQVPGRESEEDHSRRRALNAFFYLQRCPSQALTWIENYFSDAARSVMLDLSAIQRRTLNHYYRDDLNFDKITEVEAVAREAIKRRLGRINRKYRSAGLPVPHQPHICRHRARMIFSTPAMLYACGESPLEDI